MKLTQMLAHSDELMYKRFLNENTLYTDETKEEFVDDESKIVNAFAMNFLGILGAYNAAIQSSNDRSLNQIKRYFKSDASVRPDAIDDTNHNISLVIKLMRDKKMFISDAKTIQMTRFLALAKRGQLDLIDDLVVREWVDNIKLPAITKADSKIKDVLLKFKNEVFTLVDASRELRRIRAKYAGISDEFWNVSKTVRYKTKGEVEPETSEDKEAKDAKKVAEDEAVVASAPVEPEVVAAPQMGFGLPADPVPAAPSVQEPEPVAVEPEPVQIAVPVVSDPKLDQDRELRRRVAEYFIARIKSGADGMRLGSTVDRLYQMDLGKAEDKMFMVRGILDETMPGFDAEIEKLNTRAVYLLKRLATTVGLFTSFADGSINGVDLSGEDLQYAGDFRGISAIIGTELKRDPSLAASGSIENYMTNVTLPYDKVSMFFGISSREYFHMLLTNQNVHDKLLSDMKEMYISSPEMVFTALAKSPSEEDRAAFVTAMPDVVEQFFMLKAPGQHALVGTDLATQYGVFAKYGVLGNVYKYYSEELTKQWNDLRDNGWKRGRPTSYNQTMAAMTVLLVEWGQLDMLKGSSAALATINSYPDDKFSELVGPILMYGRPLLVALADLGSPQIKAEIESMLIRNLKLGNFFTETKWPSVDASQMNRLMKGRKADIDQIKESMKRYIANAGADQVTELATLGMYLLDESDPKKSTEDLIHFITENVDPSIRKVVMNAVVSRHYSIVDAHARTEVFLTIHETTDIVDLPDTSSYYDLVGRYKFEGTQAARMLKLEVDRKGFASQHAGNIKGREEKAMYKDAWFDMTWDTLETDPDLADAFYEMLPTAEKTKFRNRMASVGSVTEQLGKGLIDLGTTLDANRVKDIFTFNGLDADEIASRYNLKAVKNEKFSDYTKRVNDAASAESPLIDPMIEDLDLSPAELAAKMNYMVKNHHAGKHGDIYPKITRAFAVKLPDEAFQKFRNEMIERNRNDSVVPAYHGTGGVAACMILRYGFKVLDSKDQSVVGRAIGDGIYFSNKIDKVSQYIGNAGFSRGIGTKGYVFEMDTTLGQPNVDYQSAGFSGSTNVEFGFVSPEWAVFNPGAQLKILKCYEVELVRKYAFDEIVSSHDLTERRKTFGDVLTEAKSTSSNAITYRFFDNRIPVIKDDRLKWVSVDDFESCNSNVIRAYSDGKIATVVIKNSKTYVIDTMLRKMSTADLKAFNALIR